MTLSKTEEKEEITLGVDSELRFEIESKERNVTVELKSGFAELFGTELAKGKQYEFHVGAKVAIFTFHGCVLLVKGKADVSYVAKETPMVLYLNTHTALEQLRRNAEEKSTQGPIVMICGPQDVGKSTLCRILLNYAVRMGRPIYVDIDVGQGGISCPGTIGALLVERTASIEEGFSQQAPLVYNFGHVSPGSNNPLFKLLVSKLADVSLERLQTNRRGDGYKHLLHAARAFEVGSIFVLDQERLYNELLRDIPKFVEVIYLPKSGGVVERTKQLRMDSRDQRIREYFYGLRSPLYPHSFDVKWSDVQIYKIGAPALPDSCMPLGMKMEDNMTKLVTIQPSVALLHHILAVSFAESGSDDIIQSNVCGFISVTNVDTDRQILTVFSPQPRPLPNNILILSDVQFMDSH